MKRFLLLLLVSAGPALALAPSGEFNYPVQNLPLWDLSGQYTNATIANDLIVTELQQAANGRVSGIRREVYTNGADQGVGAAYILGKVRATHSTVSSPVHWTGTYSGTSRGVAFVSTLRARETFTIVPATLSVTDSYRERQCVVGGRCLTTTNTITLPLPAGMDGNWTLNVKTIGVANTLTGTAALTLSTGRILNYQLRGRYSPRSQNGVLILTGRNEALGTFLVLSTHGPSLGLVKLRGRVLGQYLKLVGGNS